MSGYDDISSTERLLRLIRNGEQAVSSALPESKPKVGLQNRKVGFKDHRSGIVGVEIAYSSLNMVKIGKKQQILSVDSFPIGPKKGPNTPDFPNFLNNALHEFIGSSRNSEIWTAVSSTFSEMRLLRIPKLPRRQIPNAVFWTLKKEFPFNEKETVFDYEIIGEIIEDGIRKIEVMAFTAPTQELENLKKLFDHVYFPLAGITAIPFAFRNLLRAGMFNSTDGGLCTLHIDRMWSRIDIFSGKHLMVSRSVRAGMNGMIQGIIDALQGNRSWAEEHSEQKLVLDSAEDSEIASDHPAWNLFFNYLKNASSPEEDRLDIFNAIKPALARLTRQIERTLEYYDQKIRAPFVSKIMVAGNMAHKNEILAYFGDQLNLRAERLDPMPEQNDHIIPLNIIASTDPAPFADFEPALGLALSNNDTPNLLFTYKDKAIRDRLLRLRKFAAAVCMALMLIMGGYYAFRESTLTAQKAKVESLQKELDRFQPHIDQASILKLMEVVKSNRQILKQFERRYLNLAVVKELTDLKPSDIKLLSLGTEVGLTEPESSAGNRTAAANKAVSPGSGIVKIDGAITGDKTMMESILAQYLLSLQMSPLFGKTRVTNSSYRTLEGQEILMFSAAVELHQP